MEVPFSLFFFPPPFFIYLFSLATVFEVYLKLDGHYPNWEEIHNYVFKLYHLANVNNEYIYKVSQIVNPIESNHLLVQ